MKGNLNQRQKNALSAFLKKRLSDVAKDLDIDRVIVDLWRTEYGIDIFDTKKGANMFTSINQDIFSAVERIVEDKVRSVNPERSDKPKFMFAAFSAEGTTSCGDKIVVRRTRKYRKIFKEMVVRAQKLHDNGKRNWYILSTLINDGASWYDAKEAVGKIKRKSQAGGVPVCYSTHPAAQVDRGDRPSNVNHPSARISVPQDMPGVLPAEYLRAQLNEALARSDE